MISIYHLFFVNQVCIQFTNFVSCGIVLCFIKTGNSFNFGYRSVRSVICESGILILANVLYV
jgi:hypothetical protein